MAYRGPHLASAPLTTMSMGGQATTPPTPAQTHLLQWTSPGRHPQPSHSCSPGSASFPVPSPLLATPQGTPLVAATACWAPSKPQQNPLPASKLTPLQCPASAVACTAFGAAKAVVAMTQAIRAQQSIACSPTSRASTSWGHPRASLGNNPGSSSLRICPLWSAYQVGLHVPLLGLRLL